MEEKEWNGPQGRDNEQPDEDEGGRGEEAEQPAVFGLIVPLQARGLAVLIVATAHHSCSSSDSLKVSGPRIVLDSPYQPQHSIRAAFQCSRIPGTSSAATITTLALATSVNAQFEF